MDFGKYARAGALSLAMVLGAGTAVAEETDAERCDGYPGFDGATENFEAAGKFADRLRAYTNGRYDHHIELGEPWYSATALAAGDVSYCSGLTEKLQELREKGEELLKPEPPKAPGQDVLLDVEGPALG